MQLTVEHLPVWMRLWVLGPLLNTAFENMYVHMCIKNAAFYRASSMHSKHQLANTAITLVCSVYA